MLKKELPKIGRKDVRFHGSPKYNGLTKIGNGTMTFSISAECREEDYSYVKNKLNISLQQIFLEHGYNL